MIGKSLVFSIMKCGVTAGPIYECGASVSTFFVFKHRQVSQQALQSILDEIVKLGTPGKALQFGFAGESVHYFGHTNPQALVNLERALKRRSLPFGKLQENDLPASCQEAIVLARSQGQF